MDSKDVNIFEIFEKEAKEFKVEPLAKALVDAVEGIGYPPKRLRVFTSEKAFKQNVSGVKTKENIRVLLDEKDRFNVRYDGVPYFYTYTEKVKVKPEDTYNSIFLGVGYDKKSFSRYTPLKHETVNGIEYYVYIYPMAPKCLRVGIVGSWSEKDLEKFNPYAKSTHFDDPEPKTDNDDLTNIQEVE